MSQFDAMPHPRKPSMRASINRMCKACIYDPVGGSGTWRAQVEACTLRNCPLWELRPISQPEKET
jgi:hypothetical protein